MAYMVTPGARLEMVNGKLYETLGALTEDQESALVDADPSEIRALPLDRRIELALQQSTLQVRKKEAFWKAVEGFALGVIPLIGLSQLLNSKK